MRLNFTGRQKIDKQHARVAVMDEPKGSGRGHYFELDLDLRTYELPEDAHVILEAYHKLIRMRFDCGTVGTRRVLSTTERRLVEFATSPDDVLFRVKIVTPSGVDTGKLLAEADGLSPADGGAAPLLRICAKDLGDTPYTLELVPTDPELPTLVINTRIGGKSYANDVHAKPVLMTAVVREVFASLVRAGDVGDDPNHWANKWLGFAVDVLGASAPPEDASDEDAVSDWLEQAVDAFSAEEGLVTHILGHQSQEEFSAASEIN